METIHGPPRSPRPLRLHRKYLIYKEWKLLSTLSKFSQNDTVSTLPIRNGNGHADLNLLPRTVTP